MSKQQSSWQRWLPEKTISETFSISLIIDSYETGLKIVLVSKVTNKRIEIEFPHGVEHYALTDESLQIMRMIDVEKRQGSSFFSPRWSFFEIISSPQILELKKLSEGAAEDWTLRHFVIVEEESFLDIITSTLPNIKIFNDKD